jgi:hypothetical protein
MGASLDAAAAAVLVLAAALICGPWLFAMATPQADFTRIKALYEGLTGRAGPYKMVIGIERAGTYWTYWRGFPQTAYRKYHIQLRGTDGAVVETTIGLDPLSFGPAGILDLD